MEVVLKNLTKVFPARSKKESAGVVAVNDLNLTIPDGKLVGLLGPSGCGKSTVLNMISGLLSPTEGSILFGEDDVTNIPPQVRGVGLVFQNYALYPHMTVLNNILFPLETKKGADRLPKEEMLKRAKEAAGLVQIDALLDRKPAQLSGGQQQRVAIARALVKLPAVLLLDEPLSNLDARLRLQTREEIKRIQQRTGITTVFVTHDQEEAMSISDIIVVLKDGVMQQSGKPQTIYDDPANLFVAKFLGTPPINVFDARVKGQKLYIGDEAVLDVGAVEDDEVYAAVRPEAFVPDKNGALTCKLKAVEIMGRDKSVVFAHDATEDEANRAIIPSDTVVEGGETVKFSLKAQKVYLFDKTTQQRIPFEGNTQGA